MSSSEEEEVSSEEDMRTEEEIRMEEAAEAKALGNAEYKAGNYREAIALYTQAIEADPNTPAYYTNRAACRMMLLDYAKAVEDAKSATELDSKFVKGYLRWGKALLMQVRVFAARAAAAGCDGVTERQSGGKGGRNRAHGRAGERTAELRSGSEDTRPGASV